MYHKKKEIRGAVIAAYFLSVGIAISVSRMIFVLEAVWAFCILCVLVAPVIFVGRIKNQMMVLGCMHILLAIGFHPAVWLHMENMRDERTKAMYTYFLNGVKSDSFVAIYDTALDLVMAVQADLLFHMKLTQPFYFWLHPISAALFFWGALAVCCEIRKPAGAFID